jgi:hypothetical protein
MIYANERPFADPEKAARRLMEHAQASGTARPPPCGSGENDTFCKLIFPLVEHPRPHAVALWPALLTEGPFGKFQILTGYSSR